MSDGILYVVPTDRHIERLAREGRNAETLRGLEERLTAELLPDARFCDRPEARLALAIALSDPASRAAGQLGLFEPAAAKASGGGGLLAPVRDRGGASWSRLVTAVDDAIGRLRAAGATSSHLRRVTGPGDVTRARAAMLAEALDGLDRRLSAAGTTDVRGAGRLLADAISTTAATRLAEILGSKRMRSRWILDWDRDALAWWRALADKLTLMGGGARIVLPSFDRPLHGRRDADPFDEIAEDVANALDDATETEAIEPVLGYLGSALPWHENERVTVVRAADASGQAREAVTLVRAALASGSAIDRVAIALPVLDDHSLVPLRRALDAAGIPSFEQTAEPHSEAPVIAAAILALEAAETLERTAVARLLRTGYVDAPRFVPEVPASVAWRTLARISQRLESRPTAAASDAVERLVLTVGADATAESEALRRISTLLAKARSGRTRGERIAAARALWTDLGFADQAGRGALDVFGRDTRPIGVQRAERAVVARDARAWEMLSTALEVADRVITQMGGAAQAIDDDAFRVELVALLDSTARRPAAGGGGAIRIGRIEAFVGVELDSLTILDCVEGRLPATEPPDRLLTTSLSAALVRASRGAFRPQKEGLVTARSVAALAGAAAECRRIQLVYPTEDATGALLEPSSVIDAIVRGGAEVLSETADVPARSAVTAARAARERLREAFFLDPNRPRSDIVGALDPGPSLRRLLTTETGGASRPLAVTSLERLARCAFRGTAEVVLGARDPEHRQELPDAREEGTLIHEVLAAAFTAVGMLWNARPRDHDAILAQGLTAVDGVLAARQGHAPLRAIIRLRVREGARAVIAAAIADETWNFVAAEQPFGAAASKDRGTSPWPVADVVRGAVELRLRGTIDRMDLAHDATGVRVVDYKRSASTVKESMRSLGETALQIPIYAAIASRQTGRPAEGIYMATQTRDLALAETGSKKSRERLAQLLVRDPAGLTAIEARALELVESVRGGNLVPIPATEAECRTCSLSGGCRKPRFAMVAADEGEDPS